MKKLIVSLLVIIIIGVGVYWIWLHNGGAIIPMSSTQEQNLGSLPVVNLPAVKVDDSSTYPPEQFITLKGESDSTAQGDAYRSYVQNTFIFKVAATVSEPANTDDYKAWLVRPGDNEFVAAGTLERRDSSLGPRWTLSFSSDKELKEFSQVLITNGSKVKDPNKATVILRGSF